MNPASRSSRFFAAILDSIISGVLISASVAFLSSIASGLAAVFLSFFVQVIIWHFYFIKPIKETGQTFGKKILGIQVVFADLPSTWQVIKREGFGKFLSVASVVGLAPILFNRKPLHDVFANSEVVSLNDVTEEASPSKLKWLPFLALPALSMTFTGVLLFTDLPLQGLHNMFEAQGLKTDKISGSIYKGIKINNIEFPNGYGQLQDITLRLNIFNSFKTNSIDIDEVSAQNGWFKSNDTEIAAPLLGGLSQQVKTSSPPDQKNKKEKKTYPIRIGLLKLANIETRSNKDTFKLHLFELKNLKINNGNMGIEKIQFAVDKISLSANDITFDNDSRELSVNNLNATVPVKALPILRQDLQIKVPHFKSQNKSISTKGTIAGTDFEIRIGKDDIVFKLADFPMDQVLNTDMPLESVNFSLIKNKSTFTKIESTASLCGKKFSLDGFTYKNNEQMNPYVIIPEIAFAKFKDISQMSEKKNVSDYIQFHFVAPKTNPSETTENTLSSFCYGVPSDQANEAQKQVITRISPFVKTQEAPSPSTQYSVSTGNTEMDEATFVAGFEQSKNLYRQGRFQDCVKMNHTLIPPKSMAPEKKMAFIRYAAWIELQHGSPNFALVLFATAFKTTQKISDAEGIMKSYAKMNDKENEKIWKENIQKIVKYKPESLKQLSPATQRSIASESP